LQFVVVVVLVVVMVVVVVVAVVVAYVGKAFDGETSIIQGISSLRGAVPLAC